MKTKYFRRRIDNSITAVSGLLAEDYSNRPNEYEQLSQAAGKTAYAEQHADQLAKNLISAAHNGKTEVYCIIRSVSASGMQRTIDLFYITPGTKQRPPEPSWISYGAAQILGWRLHKDRGIIVKGCGMDMAFHTVYQLERSLPELTRFGIELVSRIL